MPLVTRQVNQGVFFKVANEPADWQNGDIWIDTSQTPPLLNVNDNNTAVIVAPVTDATTVTSRPLTGTVWNIIRDTSSNQSYLVLRGSNQPTTALQAISYSNGARFNASDQDLTTYTTQAAADADIPSTDETNIRPNITTNVIDYDAQRDDTNDSVAWDPFGAAISDTAFVLRFRLDLTTITQGASAAALRTYIGFSDLPQTTNSQTAQDTMILRIDISSGVKEFAILDTEAAAPGPAGTDAIFTQAADVDTYFVEFIRTSATAYTVELFSDASYSTSIESETGVITAATGGFRFFKIFNFDAANGGEDSTNIGTVTDIEIWDGVTSV